jgi:hypothetical protein
LYAAGQAGVKSLAYRLDAGLPFRGRIQLRQPDHRHQTGNGFMRRFSLAIAAGTLAVSGSISAVFAATAPCEDTLKALRAAEATATLSAADKTKVSELETKGIERCNADDDTRADDFFAQAMKVMGK